MDLKGSGCGQLLLYRNATQPRAIWDISSVSRWPCVFRGEARAQCLRSQQGRSWPPHTFYLLSMRAVGRALIARGWPDFPLMVGSTSPLGFTTELEPLLMVRSVAAAIAPQIPDQCRNLLNV